LRETARDADLVARVGGDEFVVLGVVKDEVGATAFAQRLRERLDAHNASADRAYRVSLSVGTAVFTPGQSTTLDALRAEADAAMYKQKKGRRGDRLTASGETILRRPDGTT
jgi:diguanylate cyclase (GGDEF)-like protein